MYHGNARLTIWARTELIRQVMAGWPQAEVARQFRVSRPTAAATGVEKLAFQYQLAAL